MEEHKIELSDQAKQAMDSADEQTGATALERKKFSPALVPVIARLAAAGFTQESIARIIGVTRRTLLLWATERPEVKEALEQGKEVAIKHLVEAGLRSALGMTLVTKTVRQTERGTEVKTETKTMPPDSHLLLFFLYNLSRQLGKDEWSPPSKPSSIIDARTLVLQSDQQQQIFEELKKTFVKNVNNIANQIADNSQKDELEQ